MWHYQVILHPDWPKFSGQLGLHELYPDPLGWTQDPDITGDSIEDMLIALELMKRDIKKYPILTLVKMNGKETLRHIIIDEDID